MTETAVFDAREGLPQEALEELKRAERITAAVKDAQTAALGYWLTEADQEGESTERLGVILVQRQADPRASAGLKGSGLVLDIENAQQDQFWQWVVTMLHPEDVLRVKTGLSARLPALEVQHQTFSAELTLPRQSRPKQSWHQRAV